MVSLGFGILVGQNEKFKDALYSVKTSFQPSVLGPGDSGRSSYSPMASRLQSEVCRAPSVRSMQMTVPWESEE